MQVTLPIKVIWKGKASSIYDQQTIDRRLEILRSRTDEEAEKEKAFLQEAKERLGKRCPQQ